MYNFCKYQILVKLREKKISFYFKRKTAFLGKEVEEQPILSVVRERAQHEPRLSSLSDFCARLPDFCTAIPPAFL